MKEFSFPKSHRLKSDAVFKILFSKGKSFNKYPIRVVFLAPDQMDQEYSDFSSPANEAAVKFGFTVSKKKFKSAVHRNRIKRQLREACRLRKNEFIQELNDLSAFGQWSILFIYVADEQLHFNKVDRGMASIFRKLLVPFREKNGKS